MKKNTFKAPVTLVVILGILVGCNSPAAKVENAKEDLKQAKDEYAQARQDSIAEFTQFKKESEERIANNEKIITAFKTRMATDKKQIKAKDQKMIDELEQRNIDMRKKIEEFKENGKDHWSAFKLEFNHDMSDLEAALKNLTVKNTK